MFKRWLTKLEKVNLATTDEEREAIYRLRYKVYVEELKKGFLRDIDHERRWVKDPEDEREGVALFYTGSVEDMTGTMRIQIWEPGQAPEEIRKRFSLHLFPGIEAHTISEPARLIVRRTLRGKLILPSLARACYEYVCARPDTYFAFLYCAPGLIRAYSRLGFRPYAGNVIPNEDGIRLPMVMIVSDLDYFREVGSPLTPLVNKYFGPGKRPPLDITPFADILEGAAAKYEIDPEAVWRELQDEFLSGHEVKTQFFDDIPEADVRELSNKGFIMEVPENKVVLRADLIEKEMFLILDGVFEVLAGEKRLAVLSKGDVFGEVAFFHDSGRRSATIRALTPGKLMVLRRKFIHELMDRKPRLACQLLFNLGRIMSGRLFTMAQLYGRE